MIDNIVKYSNIINGRFDPYYYSSSFVDFYKKTNKVESANLGSLINSITNGYDFREYTEIGIPYIKVANVKNGEFDFSKIQYVKFSSYDINKQIQLKKGNILLTRKGTFGNALYLNSNYDYVISSEVFNLDVKQDKINSKYLEIILNSPIGQIQFDRNKIGAIMGSLSQEAVKQIKIPIPSQKIQHKIVDIYCKAHKAKQDKEQEAQLLLDSIDDYLLRELGIKLPKKTLSPDDRNYTRKINFFVGKRYDPYYHQPYFEKAFLAIDKIHFEKKPLGKIAKVITSGITPLSGGDAYTSSENGIPFIRSGNIEIDGDIAFEDLLYLKPHIHNGKMKSSKLQKNDILIAIVGATIGQVGIYKYDREANINQAIALVRLQDGINYEYVKEFIKSSIGQLNLDRLKRPVARANINLEEIASIQVILPSLSKQNEIANKIQSIRMEAKLLQDVANQFLIEAKKEIETIILG